ncbi:NAD-dependent epimerase/dehydratase family protein [Nocardia panacis]|uniref:NAD-dependent epimerase/dehydratase family protein n=1 Tax=Nocardia panacis TaxID=2340916 RepID=A0A3A4KQ08_9NOCA|nr:NAD-dependent epimerase/dehydratase family protein [Nocardia panacis]RJO77996.1 NAD-dependent epimerase/dehydratase family protein [Nocardia panacis]
MTRILITGGAGFIGSHLLDHYLTTGHQVAVIDNLCSGDKTRVPTTVALHTIDIRDAVDVAEVVAAEKPELILHLAAQISVRHSVTNPRNDADTNILGTLHLAQAAHRVGARIVMASTGGAMYGDDVPMPTPETVLPRTQAPYGVSKYCAEQYLSLHNRLHGTRHIALRLGNVYGPRQDPHGEAGVVAIFCGLIARDETPTIYGDGHQTRDYVYISDIVNAFTAAAGYTGHHDTFNVGSGTGTSVRQLLDAVNTAAAKSITPRYAPPRDGEWRHGALDSTRARDELGWAPTVDIDAGIQRTYDNLPETR